MIGLLVISLAWMVWAQTRLQHRVLSFLVSRAGDSPSRGRSVTHVTQGCAAALAILLLVIAVVVEMRWYAVYVRIPLALLVLLVHVPFAATLGRTKLRRIRKTVQQRMQDMGAPAEVAEAIARAGRPWSHVGTMVMLAAVLITAWHHLRT